MAWRFQLRSPPIRNPAVEKACPTRSSSAQGRPARCCLLQQFGRSVTLLDAATFPRQKVCGEYLAPAGWRARERLGLDALCARATPLERLQIIAPGTSKLELGLTDAPERQPIGLSRWSLDHALVEHAASLAVGC